MTFICSLLFMLLVFWRPQDWLIPALYGWPILDLVVGVALLAMLLEVDSGQVRFPRALPQPWLLLGLFIASAYVSNGVHTYLGGIQAAQPEAFKTCFFTLLLLVVLDSPLRFRWIARLFVTMAVVMAIHCLMQQRGGFGFAGAPPLWVSGINGAPPFSRSQFFGIFADPNDTGQFLVAAMPFSFVMFKRSSFITRILALGLCYLLYLGVLSTHSRGAEVGLAAIIGVSILLRLPIRWMPVLLPLCLVGVLGLCPIAGKALDASARDRVVMWGFCNMYLVQHPLSLLFGVGYGLSEIVATTYGMKGATMHNAFVFCYTEIGYFGFIFWMGMILMGVLGAWRVRAGISKTLRRSDEEANYLWRYSGYALCAMLGFCASGYFLSRAFIYPMYFLMATIGVIPLVAQEWINGRATEQDKVVFVEHPHTALTLCPTVGAFGMLYVYFSCIMLNLGL